MEGFKDSIPEGATPIYDENDTSGMGDVINSLHEVSVVWLFFLSKMFWHKTQLK
jgi:hypothetical protein